MLTVPSVSDTFELHTDASSHGVGSVFNVARGDDVLPVAFQSRQLRGAERCYSTTELEALSVLEAIKYFKYFLYGASFTVSVDRPQALNFITVIQESQQTPAGHGTEANAA